MKGPLKHKEDPHLKKKDKKCTIINHITIINYGNLATNGGCIHAETGGQISGNRGENANQGGQIAKKGGQNANQDGQVTKIRY